MRLSSVLSEIGNLPSICPFLRAKPTVCAAMCKVKFDVGTILKQKVAIFCKRNRQSYSLIQKIATYKHSKTHHMCALKRICG